MNLELVVQFLMIGKPDTNGGIAQLGEHLPCKQGVMGSNPIISTSGNKVSETGNHKMGS